MATSNRCVKCGMLSGSKSICPTCQQNELLEKNNEMLQKKYNLETYGTEFPLFWGLVGLVKGIFLFVLGVLYWVIKRPEDNGSKILYYSKWFFKVLIIIMVALYIIGVTVGDGS